jgi:hypothetical protein
MKESYFKPEFETTSNKSYLVKRRFIESEECGAFKKMGQLPNERLEFVLREIADCRQETFAKYFARNSERNKTYG